MKFDFPLKTEILYGLVYRVQLPVGERKLEPAYETYVTRLRDHSRERTQNVKPEVVLPSKGEDVRVIPFRWSLILDYEVDVRVFLGDFEGYPDVLTSVRPDYVVTSVYVLLHHPRGVRNRDLLRVGDLQAELLLEIHQCLITELVVVSIVDDSREYGRDLPLRHHQD